MIGNSRVETAVSVEWYIEQARKALCEISDPEIVKRSRFSAAIETDPSGTDDVVVTVITEDRPRLLAQFHPFEADSFNGFAVPFVRGWIAGRLAAERVPSWPRIHLDVFETPGTSSRAPLYEVISVADIATRLTLSVSPALRAQIDRHGIELVLVAGRHISGPSAAMLQAVNHVLGRRRYERVIDACSGSGGVAHVALSHGVAEVVSIDVRHWEIVQRTLGPHRRWTYRCGDAIEEMQRLGVGENDLVVLDPFYGETFAMARRLSGVPPSRAHTVFNGGPALMAAWQARLREQLRRSLDAVEGVDIDGERIYFANCGDLDFQSTAGGRPETEH